MNQEPHVLSISLEAIAANYRFLAARGNGIATAACVKANGYGLGAVEVARTLEAQGCRIFFVATFDEALRLRPFITGDIYVLGGLGTAGGRDFASVGGVYPVLNCMKDIEIFSGGPCAVHFDTGMNRLGLDALEMQRLASDPSLLAKADVRILMSHFACSEDLTHPMNLLQCARIESIRQKFAPLFPKALWSMCNSSGIFHYSQCYYDLLRPGYALYGGNPTPDAPNPMAPTVTLQTRILQVRSVKAGETVGYSATHRFERDNQTATVCLGYADGFARAHQAGGAQLYWGDQPCPIVGRVSMDLVCIDIGGIKGKKPENGDFLEVIGPHQDVDTLARHAGTIGYEILTSLGSRYARRYNQTP